MSDNSFQTVKERSRAVDRISTSNSTVGTGIHRRHAVASSEVGTSMLGRVQLTFPDCSALMTAQARRGGESSSGAGPQTPPTPARSVTASSPRGAMASSPPRIESPSSPPRGPASPSTNNRLRKRARPNEAGSSDAARPMAKLTGAAVLGRAADARIPGQSGARAFSAVQAQKVMKKREELGDESDDDMGLPQLPIHVSKAARRVERQQRRSRR